MTDWIQIHKCDIEEFCVKCKIARTAPDAHDAQLSNGPIGASIRVREVPIQQCQLLTSHSTQLWSEGCATRETTHTSRSHPQEWKHSDACDLYNTSKHTGGQDQSPRASTTKALSTDTRNTNTKGTKRSGANLTLTAGQQC
jgi:hypothetical protein